MKRGLVLLSGGIDSAVALAWANKNFETLFAISFLYHLRPMRELFSTYRLLQTYPATLIEVPLTYLKEATDANPQRTNKVPEGYISNRNLVFYSIAAHYAETYECESIIGGHTAEDHEAFPDASETFFHRFELLVNEASLLRRIRIDLPLIRFSKLEVLQQGLQWKVPFEFTWSCYWDRSEPCRTCISCTERAAAFENLNVVDPLIS